VGTPGGVTDDPTGSLRQILAELAGTETQDADLVLMQLDPQPAQLLELCAIPHLFDHDVVRVLDPRAPVDVVDSFMDEVQSLPSIRQIGDCFAIHDIVRGQLFERWLQPERHREFVEASRRLAEHYETASHGGNQAQAEANEPAVMFHRMGVDLEDGFRVFQDLYRRYRESARYSACEGLVRLVAEYRPVLPDRLRAWLSFYEAETARDSRDLTRALSLLGELSRQDREPALALRAHLQLSAVLRALRRTEEASEAATRALQIASAAADGAASLHLVHQELGLIARDKGDVEEASQHLRLAIELGTAAEDRLMIASAYNSLGTVLQKFDPKEAITVLESGAAQLAADALRHAQVLNNLGLAYANVGDWVKALQSFERSLEIKRASADLYGQAVTLLNVARVYQARAQQFAMRNALTESAALFETVRDPGSAAAARRDLARALRQAGESGEANSESVKAIALFQEAGRMAEAQALEREFTIDPRRRKRQRWLIAGSAGTVFLLIAAVLLLAALGY